MSGFCGRATSCFVWSVLLRKMSVSVFVLSGLVMLLIAPVANAAEPYQVKAVKDVVFKTVDGKNLKVNIYLPVKKDGTVLKGSPLLIHVAGGCWICGGPSGGGYWASWKMVEKGYAVAGICHRSLLDGHAFPKQMEDVRAAIRFLRAKAPEYGYDPTRFACMGASSAGFMSAVAGISDKHKIFDVGENLDQSSQVQCVVDFCGPVDILSMIERQDNHLPWCLAVAIGAKYPEGTPLAVRQTTNYEDQVKNLRKEAVRFSPITYADKDFAPTIVLHGAKDTVVPTSQACLFHEKLRRAGVVTELYLFNPGAHSPKTYGPDEVYRQPVIQFVEKVLGKPAN